jgi:hypothetical protein
MTQTEIDDLAHEIAEQAAKELLNSELLSVHAHGGKWLDLDSMSEFVDQPSVDAAEKYLDAIGVLHRAPSNPRLVGWDEDD